MRGARRPIVAEVAALGVVALYNVVAHRHIPRRARIVANVGAAFGKIADDEAGFPEDLEAWVESS